MVLFKAVTNSPVDFRKIFDFRLSGLSKVENFRQTHGLNCYCSKFIYFHLLFQMVERTAQILQNSSASKCLSPIPTRLLTPSRRNAAQAAAKVLSVKKSLVHSSASKGTTPSKGRASTEVTPG